MFGVGMLGSYITQGVYTVASPFQPFGGAVDIIVVQQEDGAFKSSPWFVKFGKFQGVLKRKENMVDISVNDIPTDFHMYLDHKGEAYFEKEVESDDDTILSLPSAPSSGDEKADFDGMRLLTNSQAVTVEGIEMQETHNTGTHTGMKVASVPNDDDNSNAGIEQVSSDSTVLVSDALVNQGESELLIAISEGSSHQGEGKLGTINASPATQRKGESKYKRLGKAGSKPSRSFFGYVFGEKPQHVSEVPSASEHQDHQSTAENSKSRLFLERAKIAADLLDKRWGTARKSPSPRGKTSAPESLGSEGAQLDETGLMQGLGHPVITLNEASYMQSDPLELLGPQNLSERFEEHMLDKLTSDIADIEDLRVKRERLVKSMSEEDLFLRSAAEKEALVLLFQERLGDGSSSNECSYDAMYESTVQTVRYNAAQTGSEEAVLSGMVGCDRDQETKSCPEVVLMSVDGHIITAPVNSESSQVHANESGLSFDEGKMFSSGASCVYDVQARGPSLLDPEFIELDRNNGSEQLDFVTESSSMAKILEVDVDPGLNQLIAEREPVIVEVPASSSSLEVTPQISSNGKFVDPKGSAPVNCQSIQASPENSAVTDVRAVGQILERCEARVSDDTVVPNCTVGVHGDFLESESGVSISAAGITAGCMPDGSITGVEDLHASGVTSPLTGDKWVHKHVELFPKVDLSGQSALGSGFVESPGQQGLEHVHCFRGGSTVDHEVEIVKEDIFESCLASNDAGNEHVLAVSRMSDSGSETVHAGGIFVSSEDVGLPMSEELPANTMVLHRITTMGKSQPIDVPPCEIGKRVGSPSSASLPARFNETERTDCGRFYSHSEGSRSLFNTQYLLSETDISDNSGKDLDGGLSFADRKAIVAIVYGIGKNSAEVLDAENSSRADVDLSLCRHLLSEGMGAEAAGLAFESQKISYEEFQRSGSTIVADDKLVVKMGRRYFSWVEAEPYILGMVDFSGEAHKMEGGIAIEVINPNKDAGSQIIATVSSPTRWNLWPFSFRRPIERSPLSASDVSKQALLAATDVAINSPFTKELLQKNGFYERSWKKRVHTYVPTSAQLASLKLKDGSNKVTFTFSTGVVGKTQVDARIYLWKWNTRIVVSDVDGTITKSDVLGQVMPLVGRDWSQSGVARLFSAIKENGYELLFLSARAISQAYLTRQFLSTLKQDGEALPDGPMFISPDGLIPSLYREVIRRAPHEFKIACLERIRELFPSDVNPFYAGFGNRNTDEISYLKVGVPKGKIFTINPKGEVAVNHCVDVRSYTSLHTLVDDMFPAMSSHEQEDFNSWNYWKLPLPDVDEDLIMNSARSKKKGGDSTKKGGTVKK